MATVHRKVALFPVRSLQCTDTQIRTHERMNDDTANDCIIIDRARLDPNKEAEDRTDNCHSMSSSCSSTAKKNMSTQMITQ